MDINRENYGAYFLDYNEGRLNAASVESLMAFLKENPDLNEEFGAFQNLFLVPSEMQFTAKDRLKKYLPGTGAINDKDADYYCIAKMEGDLTPPQSLEFDQFVKQKPEVLKNYKLFLRTFLEADKSITYLNKQQLRRRVIKPFNTRWLVAVSVAASFALIVLSYQVYDSFRYNEKKIYSTIHEKLKIDSIITNVMPLPVSSAQVFAKNDENTKAAHVATDNYIVHDTIQLTTVKLKKRLPIEIVELSVSNHIEIEPLLPNKVLQRTAQELKMLESKNDNVSIRHYATAEIKRQLENRNIDIEEGLKVWDLAKSGVKQLNKFTGFNVLVINEKDTVNNRNIFAFQSNIFGIYSSSTKNFDRQ